MAQHGKKYRELVKLIKPDHLYTFSEGVALAKQTSPVKFDATVEIHVTTNTDPRHADQIIRSTITLPAGTGKTKKIAVFAEGPAAEAAKKAGADIVGGEDLIEKVLAGEIEFEIAIATPEMMKPLAKAARILGPKGLMPSPKSGTVNTDTAKAVEELKKGKIEFRTDKTGIIHSIIGKVSFSEKSLLENLEAFLKAVNDNKPAGVKGALLKTITLATAMGPGIKIDPTELSK